MILRIIFFFTLLTVFYFYCKEENPINKDIKTNDINIMDVSPDMSPVLYEANEPLTTSKVDSSNNYVSNHPYLRVGFWHIIPGINLRN